MKQKVGWAVLTTVAFLIPLKAGDFRQDSVITQLVGDVSAQPPAGTSHAAQLQEKLTPGDLLKTGADSRAELTSGDSTIIRVGANSLFSFSDQTRQMILQQGSVLFHTPHGEGGGVIKTSAVTAAVTGSTVAISTTSSGGAKVIPLESPCTITGANGRMIARINPGQLLALLPGGRPIVLAINLAAFTQSAGLIKSFSKPLAPAVQGAIDINAQNQANNIQEKTNVFLSDDKVLTLNGGNGNGPDPRNQPPPPPLFGGGGPLLPQADGGQPPPGLPPITFDADFVAKLTMDFNVNSSLFSSQSGNLFPLIGQPMTTSVPAYIYQVTQAGPLSGYFTGQLGPAGSDKTLATLGVTPAFPNSFTFPQQSRALVGRNVALIGGPPSPASIDFSSVQNAGFFGIVALGNMMFQASNGSSDFDISNGPAYVSFGSGGMMSFDGSGLTSPNYINFSAGTSNLSFGSVGGLSFKNVHLNTTTGNIYVGSLTSVQLIDTNFQTSSGAISLFSGGPLSLDDQRGANSFSASGDVNIQSRGQLDLISGASLQVNNYGNVNIVSGGPMNLNGSTTIYENGSSQGSVNLSSGGTLNLNGSLTIIGSYAGASTVNISSLADFNFTGLASITQTGVGNLNIIAANNFIFNPSTVLNLPATTQQVVFSADTIFLNNIIFNQTPSNIIMKTTTGTIYGGAPMTPAAAIPHELNIGPNVHVGGTLISGSIASGYLTSIAR